MIMWIVIIALLAIGLTLKIVEIVFIPGTTVVGFLGLIFSIAGIVIGYRHFGNETGFYILITSTLITVVALFYSFRSNAWSRFSLKTSNNSRVNEGMLSIMEVGEEGKTISTLRPIGKAEFAKGQYEVRTTGDYVENGTRVRIREIQSNQIIVEPII